MSKKYNLDLLKSICVSSDISVEIENYGNVNRDNEITYSCNICRNVYKKKFGSLYNSSNKCIYCFDKSKYKEWFEKSKQFHEDVYDYSKVIFNNLSTKVIIICKVHGEFHQTPSNHTRFGCSKCGGNYNYTTEEWIKKAREVHGNKYDYSKVMYLKSKTKVTIGCKEHGDFEQTPGNHLNLEQGCSKCGGNYNYTTEEWIEKAKEVHENKYDYSKVEYINKNTKVIIICKVHGEFEQTPGNHVNNYGCYKCGGTYNYSTEEWIKKAKEVHGNKYDYSKVEYIRSCEEIIIICNSCKYEFNQVANSHMQGGGCSKCSGKYSYTTEEWVEKAKEVHKNKYDYSKVEYINTNTKVKIICIDHGEFEQTPNAHVNQQQGCPCCNIFKSESLCRSILNNLTTSNFIKARPTFLGGLELDGYCEELKCAFEYNGKQHYYYNKHFHRNGIKDLISQNIRDKIKKQICEENGIKLISIPYNYDHKNPKELGEYIKFNYNK